MKHFLICMIMLWGHSSFGVFSTKEEAWSYLIAKEAQYVATRTVSKFNENYYTLYHEYCDCSKKIKQINELVNKR